MCLSVCCSHLPVRLGVASLPRRPSSLCRITAATSTCLTSAFVPGLSRRLLPLFIVVALPFHRPPLHPPPGLSHSSALPPTKSRDCIPPPSHPASAQHASIRRNRPSFLDPLHSALALGLFPPPTDAPAIILIRLPTHFASVARLPYSVCTHGHRPCDCPPAGSQSVVHSTSLPRPPLSPLLPAAAVRTPYSPVSR